MKVSTIKLYQLIADKTDNKIAQEVVTILQDTIEEEVKDKTTDQMKDLKIELIDKINNTEINLSERINNIKIEMINKINSTKIEMIDKINSTKIEMIDRIDSAKMQTIMWIVGIGVLQLVAGYLLNK